MLYDIDFTKQDADDDYRKQLEEFANINGAHALHEKLKDIDPVSYETIHENNVKRVIRALEYYKQTNEPISKHNEEEKQKESPYNFAYFVLNDVRENLYSRIDKRVDIMMEAGLLDEIKALKNSAASSHRLFTKENGLHRCVKPSMQPITHANPCLIIIKPPPLFITKP